MLNIVCTSKPADGLLFYSYEYCSHLNEKGIQAQVYVVTHRDFTSGDYTDAIKDKYIHCQNIVFNNEFIADDSITLIMGRSMLTLAHMTWNDYSDMQKASVKKLFSGNLVSVYSENHPEKYPKALKFFKPKRIIDLCDTDVYPNGVGEHFEKIIHFPVYKEVKEDIQFDHLFLGTNPEYYKSLQKIIGEYPDHGILTYPQKYLDLENNNLRCPVDNLLGKFKTYVYTKETFDPAPRLFQEARWLGKEIIYHRTNPVQDGGYWYWKRGLKNQDIGPIITALDTFDGKITIETKLASANHREQIGNLEKANTVDFSIAYSEVKESTENNTNFFCNNPYSSPVKRNGKYAPCKIAKPSNRKYKSIETWLDSKELHDLRTDMLNSSHPFSNTGKEFNNETCTVCINDPSKRNTEMDVNITRAATRTKLNLPHKIEGRYLELEVWSDEEIDSIEKLSPYILKLNHNGGSLDKLEQWKESKNIELTTHIIHNSNNWKSVTMVMKNQTFENSEYTLFETLQASPTFWCPHFFDHIHTNTSGTYSVCCVGRPTSIKYSDMTPSEWYHGNILTSCRKASIGTGTKKDKQVLVNNCRSCIKAEKLYGKSERTDNIQAYLHQNRYDKPNEFTEIQKPLASVMKKYIETGEVVLEPGLIRLQLRIFGNTCNLDCYMCQPQNSSVRYNSVGKSDEFDVIFPIANDSIPIVLKDHALESLDDMIPYIRTVTLQGGEPLFIKHQFKLLDKLIKLGVSKNIIIDMNTNGTILGVGKHNILDYAKHFKRLDISISLDGFGKYNDYIRRRSVWHDIVRNINTLKKVPNTIIGIFSTLSILSILRMDELIDFVEGMDLAHHTLFVIDDPAELNPNVLPEKLKQKLRIKYKNNEIILRTLNPSKIKTKEFNNAMNYLEKTDKEYGTNVFELYPELKEYCYE